MVQAYAHEGHLELADGADDRAPAAAVTVSLCGHWDHEGDCRWRHHTSIIERDGHSLTVRTVFASDIEDEQEVRERIVAALESGLLAGPAGESRWQVLRQEAVDLRPADQRVAGRLTRS
ncbi:MAG TPA: hypothetical protein VMI11_10155 [Actinomycetes bacterium]|nr:hypothetical protein [Actinomycetes bacterium]